MKAVILAAGLSRRMKVQKLALPFGDGTVLSTVIHNVSAAGFDEVVAVVSRQTWGLAGDRVTRVVNERPEDGQGSSLALGVLAIGECDFCVALGDLPLITSDEIRLCKAAFDARGAGFTALVPRREGRFGHPAFFSAAWRQRFVSLGGDAGGRSFLKAHADEIMFCEGKDSFFRDVDTPDDYGQICCKRL